MQSTLKHLTLKEKYEVVKMIKEEKISVKEVCDNFKCKKHRYKTL